MQFNCHFVYSFEMEAESEMQVIKKPSDFKQKEHEMMKNTNQKSEI